jgi:hypothetical protein
MPLMHKFYTIFFAIKKCCTFAVQMSSLGGCCCCRDAKFCVFTRLYASLRVFTRLYASLHVLRRESDFVALWDAIKNAEGVKIESSPLLYPPNSPITVRHSELVSESSTQRGLRVKPAMTGLVCCSHHSALVAGAFQIVALIVCLSVCLAMVIFSILNCLRFPATVRQFSILNSQFSQFSILNSQFSIASIASIVKFS